MFLDIWNVITDEISLVLNRFSGISLVRQFDLSKCSDTVLWHTLTHKKETTRKKTDTLALVTPPVFRLTTLLVSHCLRESWELESCKLVSQTRHQAPDCFTALSWRRTTTWKRNQKMNVIVRQVQLIVRNVLVIFRSSKIQEFITNSSYCIYQQQKEWVRSHTPL